MPKEGKKPVGGPKKPAKPAPKPAKPAPKPAPAKRGEKGESEEE